jgi:hypothetical protein
VILEIHASSALTVGPVIPGTARVILRIFQHPREMNKGSIQLIPFGLIVCGTLR